MANTANITIGATWTLIAEADIADTDLAASAQHPTDTAEWVVTSGGAPSESVVGHPVPRTDSIEMILKNGEKLYFRSISGNVMKAAVTVG